MEFVLNFSVMIYVKLWRKSLVIVNVKLRTSRIQKSKDIDKKRYQHINIGSQ